MNPLLELLQPPAQLEQPEPRQITWQPHPCDREGETLIPSRWESMGRNRYNRWRRLVQLWKLTRGRCSHCDQRVSIIARAGPQALTFDHIIPASHGGRRNWANARGVCRTCNEARGNSALLR